MNDDDNGFWRGFEARLERLEDLTKELDEVLRGSRRNRQSGLVADQEKLELEVRKLSAVVFVDSTGKRGIAHDVDVLMGRRRDKDETRGLRWQSWTAIVITLLGIMGKVILSNLPRIKQELLKVDPLEKKIERAKHPKGKKIYRIKVVPASEEPSSPTKDTPPN